MTALSNRTYTHNHMLYKRDNIGEKSNVAMDKRSLAKEFKIGNTLIRIFDDYCRDKTPEDVQAILDRIAHRVEEQLAMQEALAQSHESNDNK